MVTWNELLEGRKQMQSMLNSAHMLDCMKKVKDKFPNAEVKEVGRGEWRLVNGDEALSNVHASHYACWMEATEVMNVPDQ